MKLRTTLHVVLNGFMAFVLSGATIILLWGVLHVAFGKTYSGTVLTAQGGVGGSTYNVELDNGPKPTVLITWSCRGYCTAEHHVGERVKVRVGSDGSADFVGFFGNGFEAGILTLMCGVFAYLAIQQTVSYIKQYRH